MYNQAKSIKLKALPTQVMFWTKPTRVRRSVDLHVSPAAADGVVQSLQTAGLDHVVVLDDLGR